MSVINPVVLGTSGGGATKVYELSASVEKGRKDIVLFENGICYKKFEIVTINSNYSVAIENDYILSKVVTNNSNGYLGFKIENEDICLNIDENSQLVVSYELSSTLSSKHGTKGVYSKVYASPNYYYYSVTPFDDKAIDLVMPYETNSTASKFGINIAVSTTSNAVNDYVKWYKIGVNGYKANALSLQGQLSIKQGTQIAFRLDNDVEFDVFKINNTEYPCYTNSFSKGVVRLMYDGTKWVQGGYNVIAMSSEVVDEIDTFSVYKDGVLGDGVSIKYAGNPYVDWSMDYSEYAEKNDHIEVRVNINSWAYGTGITFDWSVQPYNKALIKMKNITNRNNALFKRLAIQELITISDGSVMANATNTLETDFSNEYDGIYDVDLKAGGTMLSIFLENNKNNEDYSVSGYFMQGNGFDLYELSLQRIDATTLNLLGNIKNLAIGDILSFTTESVTFDKFTINGVEYQVDTNSFDGDVMLQWNGVSFEKYSNGGSKSGVELVYKYYGFEPDKLTVPYIQVNRYATSTHETGLSIDDVGDYVVQLLIGNNTTQSSLRKLVILGDKSSIGYEDTTLNGFDVEINKSGTITMTNGSNQNACYVFGIEVYRIYKKKSVQSLIGIVPTSGGYGMAYSNVYNISPVNKDKCYVFSNAILNNISSAYPARIQIIPNFISDTEIRIWQLAGQTATKGFVLIVETE